VEYEDLTQELPLLAQGDVMTFDLASGVMELARTTPFVGEPLNLPEEAMASFTFGESRLQGRVIYYLGDDETGDRLLWTQRGGAVDVKRLDETAPGRPLMERTQVRCQGTILQAPPHRLVEAARRAKLPFGTRPMPEARLLDPDETPASTGVLLFVDKVRLRREIPKPSDGVMYVELDMKCGYLEVHFSEPEAGASSEGDGTSGPKEGEAGGSADITKMGAQGHVNIVHVDGIRETLVKGDTAVWRRDPRRQWIAEVVGEPYAEFRKDDWKQDHYVHGKKVKLWGYPAEVRIDETESMGGMMP
jgi:hypothetical protein